MSAPGFSAAAWIAEALRLGFDPVAVVGADRPSVYVGEPADPISSDGSDVALWASIRTPDKGEHARRWADVRAELVRLGRSCNVSAGGRT